MLIFLLPLPPQLISMWIVTISHQAKPEMLPHPSRNLQLWPNPIAEQAGTFTAG